MIFGKHANLKYKFGNRHFWAEGYYVSTVGLNEATIKKYIPEQECRNGEGASGPECKWNFCKIILSEDNEGMNESIGITD